MTIVHGARSFGDVGYRRLGIIANPFAPLVDDSVRDPLSLELCVHAKACELIRTVDAAAGEDRKPPIVLAKGTTTPAYYFTRALVEVEAVWKHDPDLGVLAVYVPLFMMTTGWIRGPLSMLADHISGPYFETMLGTYAKAALDELDTALPEAALLTEEDFRGFLERTGGDPSTIAVDTFGGYVMDRHPEDGRIECMMEASSERLENAGAESDETPSTGEEIIDDPHKDDFTRLSPDREGEGDAETVEGAVAEYVVAHMRAHLSPVIARAVAAYRATGACAVAQELRVTKAPRKTLFALARFANGAGIRPLLLFDDFEAWDDLEAEHRSKLLTTLTDLRWGLAEGGVVGLMLPDGGARELHEQFAAAMVVDWRFNELARIEQDPDALDPPEVSGWWRSACLEATPAVAEPPAWLGALIAEADGDLARFATSAAATIENAVDRELAEPDDESIEAGRAAVSSAVLDCEEA